MLTKDFLNLTYNIAKKIIKNSFINVPKHENEKFKIAKAHFTLSQRPKLALSKMLMHLNSCISILDNINKKNYDWIRNIAVAYYKRGEIFELQSKYDAAILDYKKAATIISEIKTFKDKDILVFSNANLAIANILIFKSTKNNFPISNKSFNFSNIALKALLKSKFSIPNLFSCLALAYQTYGISISEKNPNKAIKYLHLSLKVAYKLESNKETNTLILENFRFLKIIYFLKSMLSPSSYKSIAFEDCSIIYDFLNQMLDYFMEDDDEEMLDEDLYPNFLEELIAKLKNHNKFYIPKKTIINVIDALIFLLKYDVNKNQDLANYEKFFKQLNLEKITENSFTSFSSKILEKPLHVKVLTKNAFSLLKHFFYSSNQSFSLASFSLISKINYDFNADQNFYKNILNNVTNKKKHICKIYNFPLKTKQKQNLCSKTTY